MNYLMLSKKFKLPTDLIECEHSCLEKVQVSNYTELEEILTNYNYDIIPGNILIDVRTKFNVTEEALATPETLILTSDGTKIEYTNVIFPLFTFNQSLFA